MSGKKTKKRSVSTGKRIFDCITTILVALVVLLAALMAGVRLIGLQPYAVLSGSMEPVYPVGALLYVKPCDASEVAVGDVITFVLNEDLVVATHRVVAVDTENGRFRTKGDANDSEDGAPVLFGNLIGKPVFSVPLLGYLSVYLSKAPGKYIGIAFVVLLVLLLFLPDILGKNKKKSSKKPLKKGTDAEQET